MSGGIAHAPLVAFLQEMLERHEHNLKLCAV